MLNAPQDLGVNLMPDNPAHAPDHALIPCAYLCASTRDSFGNACQSVKGFTPLCLTWAVFDSDGLITYLCSRFHQRYEPTRWEGEIERVGMNLVVIEEHQVGDLVFAQVHYLYTLLEATSAYVIVPIAKVPQTKYSSYQY